MKKEGGLVTTIILNINMIRLIHYIIKTLFRCQVVWRLVETDTSYKCHSEYWLFCFFPMKSAKLILVILQHFSLYIYYLYTKLYAS